MAAVILAVCLCVWWFGGSHPNAPIAIENRPTAEHLQVKLSRDLPVSEAELETVRDQLTRIWQREGVVVELTTSGSNVERLRLVLTGALIRVTPANRNLCDLGSIRFVGGVPQPELRVSVSAAREFVRQARPEWTPAIRTLVAARVVGRVAAHELGHYLLAESGHRSNGLMRARFEDADLLGPHLGAFAPPHRVDVEAGLVRLMTNPAR